MNERIKELELEAAYGNIDPNGALTGEEFNQFTAKFAELIVGECAELMEKQHSWITNVAASNLIRKHFGVEE
jgi:hypothetical protein